VNRENKRALLSNVLRDPAMQRVVVFTRTKHGANRVAEHLTRSGVRAEAIHGNKSQGARQRALGGFKAGAVRVLVATDIAARGLDIDDITHVVNFELPNEPETYVHRIGRTGRAGAAGIALSFCDREEQEYLRDIERLTRTALRVVDQHPYAPRRPETRTRTGA
jgi:ATP-dependent RNA helicase RhlE